MKRLGIRAYWLLGFSLICMLGCGGKHIGRPTVDTPSVTITSACKANPDAVKVSIGDTLSWTEPGSGYTANFPKKNPFDASIFPSPSTISAGTPGEEVTGSLGCNIFSVKFADPNDPKSVCYFPYTLYKGPNQPCPDPGVRVVPPTNFSFGLWIKSLL